ncbi:MAG TPA: hypothetical protein VIN40_09650 [Candidatus Tyrphobacter sp.]
MVDQWLQYFFAYAPWVMGIAIVSVAYFATRTAAPHAPVGQTFACAKCGRRGREQMVSVTHDGAVSWYCPDCA